MRDDFIRSRVAVLTGLALCAAIALVLGQPPFANSRFEFGETREFRGELSSWPFPNLKVGGQRMVLTGEGKHGAGPLPEGEVSLRAQRIIRGDWTFLQFQPGSLRTHSDQMLPQAPEFVERGAWEGEIVDTKCFAGVMNPGEGKVHRDCAARCLRGGVPPGFAFRDGRLALLEGFDRTRTNAVGERTRLSGALWRLDNLLILRLRE